MAVQLTDYALWAKGLAARLRVLQASFADDNPATRQGYIADEIERALKQVPANKRRAWLGALSEEFPAWQAAGPAAPAPAPVAPGEPKPLSPDELLSQLIDCASSLPDGARAEFAKKLAAAGLAPKSEGAGSLGNLDLPAELLKSLGVGPGESISPERAAKVFPILAEIFVALDQWVWAVWRALAKERSNIRREADGVKLLGQYLKGTSEVAGHQLIPVLDKTKKVNAALLGGIGRAGGTFAARHLDQFSPDAILSLAQIERGFRPLETRAWNKYVELAKEYATDEALNRRFQEAIVRATEELVNRGRNPTQ